MTRNKVLILANYDIGLYKFRKELLEELIKKDYEVYISLPNGDYIQAMKEMGCKFIDTPMERRGTNPINDLKLLSGYFRLIKQIRPNIVFSYTVKPNIYGGIVAAKLKIPYVPNVTGLGTAVESEDVLSKLILCLYKYAFKKAQAVFFQNNENRLYFEKRKIAVNKHKLLPGSGVNLQQYTVQEYPILHNIQFAFISRIMKDKGADEFFAAAKYIKEKYSNIEFHVCGFCEENYEGKLKELQRAGIVTFHGMVKDIREVLKDIHCVVLPSYHEGMSNVLLESAASGRPIIASDIAGCRETIENGKSGFLVNVRDEKDLILKMEQFIALPYEKKREMGIAARKYVEQHFDRKIVIDAYIKEIEK